MLTTFPQITYIRLFLGAKVKRKKQQNVQQFETTGLWNQIHTNVVDVFAFKISLPLQIAFLFNFITFESEDVSSSFYYLYTLYST